jgi:GAF domain-containing protein
VGNLLDNAIKFTPTSGTVSLSLRVVGGVARLTVEDKGIGMAEPELAKIFERFYQVDGSTTRDYGGQGLGLAICREIISWHNGRIWAERRRSGGTRFIVTIPVRGLVIRRSSEDLPADVSERQQWEAFLQLSVSLVSEMLEAHVASVMLVDSVQEVLRIEAAIGLPQEVVEGVMMGPGEGVAGHVWKTGQALLVEDLDADQRFRGLHNEVAYDHRSFLSVPLIWQDRVVGVLNVNNHPEGRAFGEDDRLLLEALAERVAGALDSFERYRSGYRRLASVEAGVRAMLDVGRERHTVLRDILIGVGLETGRRLDLDEEHLRALAYALRTYDLGLSQVSEQIMRKISPLTSEERHHIENHVQLGAELVAELEPSPRVRSIILHHHENFDGSGYPEGLRGEAIPLGARIVRMVDALSALLHDRPFRAAMSLDEALELLDEGIGRRFCPRVAPVFLELVKQSESNILASHIRHTTRAIESELDLIDAHPIVR